MKGRSVWIATIAMIAGELFAGVAKAQKPPLLLEKDVAALANELSGETAKRNLEVIATFHRQRGSRGFHAAAELVAERARAYGLSDVRILEFPADGKIFYGTQRSRPAWDAEVGELWELDSVAAGCYEAAHTKPQSDEEARKVIAVLLKEDCDPELHTGRLVASYEGEPVVLAEDSESADVTADLVDVGEGIKESDYAGKNVKGKIVLASAQPGAVQDLAVGKVGAAGIVSYAQNQKTAWWGEDENLIRWGHLETFSEHKTFAFMVSLKTARGMRERLAHGEKITLHAVVKAGQYAGNYEVVTATIPGSDAKLKEEEVAFSCHLDHQRPGANDNASGCVTILEVARTLQKLIAEGKLARPARTIRFIWPPEIEGTLALLNGKPEFAKRIKAVIHMDMVGGGPETKAVFHVTRGPMSLPSFVHDVAWAFAEFVNEESYKFAATGKAEYPFVAPEGGKEPLRAEYSAYTMGSDHDVYQDSSFGIPAIYLNDWPDRYIHTNFDTAANIDTTKLKRAAFIGAASGYFLAGDLSKHGEDLAMAVKRGELLRQVQKATRDQSLSKLDREDAEAGYCYYEREIDEQLTELSKNTKKPGEPANEERRCFTDHPAFDAPTEEAREKLVSYKRKAEPKGPLAVFGYDYFEDHAKAAGVATPRLLSFGGLWGSGEEYGYEALNLVNTAHSRVRIWEQVSAEYGPVPYELVVEYLRALKKIGVVAEVK
ncbi:MAG TPA: M28 family peptidase [Candidatus Acidoferrum sp.]|nr:M28 family peptidase [Candidatus Acidoferrum sp.]